MENPFGTPPLSAGQEQSFPPKPSSDVSSTLIHSISSAVIFMVAWYFLISKDITQILILVLVLFIHEMGHFLAMKIFGYNDLKVFFVPLFGAFASGRKKEISQRQRAIILLAGPVPGILIGIVLYLSGLTVQYPVIMKLANMFVFLNAFNLIPVSPFDGGKLIETLFFSSREILTNIFTVASMVIISFLAIYFKIYMLLIIPFFMITGFRSRIKLKNVRSELMEAGLDYNKSFEEMTDSEFWLIRKKVIQSFDQFRRIDEHVFQTVPQERAIRNQMIALRESKMIFDLRIGGKMLLILIWLVFVIALPLYSGYLYGKQRREIQKREIINLMNRNSETIKVYYEN